MTENPYESPQEQNQPPRKPYQIAAATGCLVAASIPAGFICGGITCYSVGIAGEAVNTEAGWSLGILPALVVVVLVPCLVYLVIRRAEVLKAMFRFNLRTLLIVLALGPPVLALAWWQYATWRARSHARSVRIIDPAEFAIDFAWPNEGDPTGRGHRP